MATKAFMSVDAICNIPFRYAKEYREAYETARDECRLDTMALFEAQRILAETERPQTMFGGHNVAFPVSLTLLNRDYIDDGALESIALAESLAAFVEG